MKGTLLAGIVLIVLGVLALVYQGITYTKEEKVAEIGPFEARTEEEETIPLPPVLGAVAIAGGIALVVIGARR